MAKTEIYQLKITLKYSKPPIWRRVLVKSNITLAELHATIQPAMGWYDSHLHQFMIDDVYYGEPHPDYTDMGMDMENEAKYRLNRIAPTEGSKFVYEYDFGDSWLHDILVEKILPPEKGVRYPQCIKGKLACPPEDVGGVYGYYDLLEIIKDPSHDEHDEYLEWLGDDFDPAYFSLEETNEALNQLR